MKKTNQSQMTSQETLDSLVSILTDLGWTIDRVMWPYSIMAKSQPRGIVLVLAVFFDNTQPTRASYRVSTSPQHGYVETPSDYEGLFRDPDSALFLAINSQSLTNS